MVGYNTIKQEYTKAVKKVDPSNLFSSYGFENYFLNDERYGKGSTFEDNPDSKSFEEFKKLLEGEMEKRNNGLERGIDGEKIDKFKDVYMTEKSIEYGGNNSPNYSFSVIKEKMPSGLFGWTRTGSGRVHVNNRLYKDDELRTVRHEITHLLNPGKDELTIRYLNGDIDPENTLSSNYM